MKKIFVVIAVALSVASCTTTKKTAASLDVNDVLKSETTADLVVSGKRISYTLEPSKSVRRAGMNNVKAYAVSEALKAFGVGDVLVEAQFETGVRRGLFGKKIKSVTVTGYPATYKNFRNAK